MSRCSSERSGTCSSGRDLHYVTFDGHRREFGSGSCLYEFVRACGASGELVGFQVLVQNKGPHDVSFARSVQVIVYGYNVTLSHEFPGRAMVRLAPPRGSCRGLRGGG